MPQPRKISQVERPTNIETLADQEAVDSPHVHEVISLDPIVVEERSVPL